MQTFQLSFTSRIHFVIFILGGILLTGLSIGLLSYYAGLGGLAEIICIVAVIYIFLKAGKCCKQQATFSLSENDLRIKWGKGPWFSTKKDQQIEWSSLASYKLEPDRLFNVFVLKLHSGEKLHFTISKLNDQERDFREFYRKFLNKIESLEQTHQEGKSITIEKARTFYETTFGIVFIFILAAALIVTFVYSLFK